VYSVYSVVLNWLLSVDSVIDTDQPPEKRTRTTEYTDGNGKRGTEKWETDLPETENKKFLVGILKSDIIAFEL
jgi:hypothetical protein